MVKYKSTEAEFPIFQFQEVSSSNFFINHSNLYSLPSLMALYLSKSQRLVTNIFKRNHIVLLNLSNYTHHDHHHHASFQSKLRNLTSVTNDNPTLFRFHRLESTKAQTQLDMEQEFEQTIEELNFPGGNVKFTSNLEFIPESAKERVHCYRILDDNGKPVCDNFEKVEKEVALKIYSNMVTLQVMDSIFYEAQRQGRISFYVTTIGEEAINIASAAALNPSDYIFPQYREAGVLLWRGFSLQDFANQCFGNKADNGKGRQMPIHYGSNKFNYFTVSSTVATQLIHAVGAAYGLKMEGRDSCAVTFFGDGGTSTGDFHAALNFAAVKEVPIIFFCRNNGWAISTPVEDQFRSDGIVVKGAAYGIRSIRVDGNDALAIYNAVSTARKMAISEQRPILIEALTYRAGHHSTSDDSTKYRSADEIKWWRTAQDPVSKFRKFVEREGWWSDQAESELKSNIRKQMLHAIQVAEGIEKPPVKDMFTDVYDTPPSNLDEQELSLREAIRRYPADYPSSVPC